jgi:hypothetical protein
MSWLSIIMAIISFFITRKGDGKNNVRAVLAGAAVGLGTYYVTHDTEWGSANLGWLDGVVTPPDGATAAATSTLSAVGTDSTGKSIVVPVAPIIPGATNTTGTLWDNVAKLGPVVPAIAGVAAGAAISSGGLSSMLPWILAGLGIYLVLK